MGKGAEVAALHVRGARKGDEGARRAILEVATRELRDTYRPREHGGRCGAAPSGTLVALRGGIVVGTAEYVLRDGHLYLQGVAVHQGHRNRGVCRALFLKAEEIAKAEETEALSLCAIEETGNVEVFARLGFGVVGRGVAPNHVSPGGGAVTQVDMVRTIA